MASTRKFIQKAEVPADLLAQADFVGRIHHVTYQNEDDTFRVVTFQTAEEEIKFKASGNFYGAHKGTPMRIKGQWREHKDYGWTFQVESFVDIVPTTEDAILSLLGSGIVKGVGKRVARKIVDHFGEKTLEVLNDAPELLSEVPKLKPEQARLVTHEWAKWKRSQDVLLFLKQQDLSNAIALRLLRHYGDNAAAVLKQNPYQVGLDVKHIGFVKADEIAAKMGMAKTAPERLRAAFVHVLDQAQTEGHTNLSRGMLLERAVALLDVEVALVTEALDEAVSRGELIRARVDDDPECFFMKSLHRCEVGLSGLLLNIHREAKPLMTRDVDARIHEFEERYRFALAPAQQDAVRSAVSGGIIVVTGGPGTGKTTLVRALLHLLKSVKVEFALASPTGRAAQRLSETTKEEACTIHRLLKWNAQTGRFTYTPENPLPLNLLIVDEASMLDVPLAWSLMRAIPSGATVVFVGDVDQLPSVGPGMFLRDVIESQRAKVTRLDVIFRQAQKSLIIQNSHRINAGQTLVPADPEAKDSDFFTIDREEPEKVRDALLAMAIDRMPRKLGCDPVEGIQILTPMRRGILGTHELNKVLQERLNADGEPILPGHAFRRGDKVMQIVNNYDLDVYNGDVGRIAGFDPETRTVRVVYGKRAVFYPPENLEELELAYAITIHKSQGSEYPGVIVVLHTTHYVMLKRNLLYTGVTRGKRLVVIVGNRRALYTAIRSGSESERRTALRYWLTHDPETGDLFR